MEDFGGIIWTIAVIGFAVYSMAVQQRKKAEKGARKPAHGEAWPVWEVEPEPRKKPEDTEPEIMPETDEFPEREQAREPIREIRQEMVAAQKAQVYGGRLLEQVSEAEEDSLRRTSECAVAGRDLSQQSESSDDPTADFDLRKAVIYSEILKPKFDENE